MISEYLGPLRRRLSVVFAFVLIVPTTFGIVAAIDHYRSQVEQARRSTERYATLASNDETNLLWQSGRIAEDVGRDPIIQAALAGSAEVSVCQAVLKRAIDPYPVYAVASLLAPDGRPICRSNGSLAPSDAGTTNWFKASVSSGEPTISNYTFAPVLHQPILVYGTPVKDASGHVVGVVGLAIRLQWLAADGQEAGLPPEASVDLLDKNGAPLVTSEPKIPGSNGLPDDATLKRVTDGMVRSFDAFGRDGVERNYAVHPIADGGLFILLGQPTRTLIAPLQHDLSIQIAILCLVVLGGLLAALVGSRLLVTRWIALLTDEARAITTGDTPHGPSFSGAPTEIRELNETLTAMAARIKAREVELSESLAQKQMMLREIHHRVKNNLQTVTSLLNLYARIPRGEAIKAAFSDVQTRINTLALVHRHLYESQDLREIDLAAFMSNLCRLVQDGSGVPARRVKLIVGIPSMMLSGDRAVPLALLTTELLTNAFKHAFPEHRAGMIRVQIVADGAGNATLTISDDGIGYRERQEASPTSTMGQSLIAAFTRQLGGTLDISGPPGTVITLAFPLEPKPVDHSLPPAKDDAAA
jgi:two-component sensor histidine kinase